MLQSQFKQSFLCMLQGEKIKLKNISFTVLHQLQVIHTVHCPNKTDTINFCVSPDA